MPRTSIRSPRAIVLAAAVAVSAAALAACGDDSTAAPPTTTAPDAPPTTPKQPAAVSVDWVARTVTGVPAAEVSVDFCEGEAPFLCFTRDDEHVGKVELVHYPTAGDDVIEQAMAAGGESAALEAIAADLVAHMAADRAEGCGAAYEVVPNEPVAAVVAGEDGLRYGFRGVVNGTTVEDVVLHALIDDGTLWIFAAAGYDDGGCLPREGEFDVAGVRSAIPLISELAAGSILPAPDQTTGEG